jgi:hypothetical protein
MDFQSFLLPITKNVKKHNKLINTLLISFIILNLLPIDYLIKNDPLKDLQKTIRITFTKPIPRILLIFFIYVAFITDSKMFILIIFITHQFIIHLNHLKDNFNEKKVTFVENETPPTPPVIVNGPPMDEELPPMDEELPPMDEELPPMDEELPPMDEELPPMDEELPPVL